MDTWEIKLAHTMTLWGIITPKIEYLVARYSTMVDHARNYREMIDIENEFKITMHTYGIVCD